MTEVTLLTDIEVAKHLRVSVALVRRWRVLKTGPRFIKVGGALVRYRLEDVEAYLESCRSGGGPAKGDSPAQPESSDEPSRGRQ